MTSESAIKQITRIRTEREAEMYQVPLIFEYKIEVQFTFLTDRVVM